MPKKLSAAATAVDSHQDDLSCDAAMNPTKDDTMILLLCEKLIESGEADRDPETAQMVDKHLSRLREKYAVDTPAPKLRVVPPYTGPQSG